MESPSAADVSGRYGYGLELCCETPLPFMSPSPCGPVIEKIEFGLTRESQPPSWVHTVDPANAENDMIRQSAEQTVIRFSEHGACSVSADGQRIQAWLTEESDLRYLTPPVSGWAVSLVWQLHGALPLHAGGIVVDNQAALIAGSSGIGKSSVVSSAAQAGIPLLGDEIMIITGVEEKKFLAVPSVPFISLLPDQMRRLDLAKEQFCLKYPESTKRMAWTPQWRLADDAAPLRAVFFLRRAESAGEIGVRRLDFREAAHALHGIAYGNWLLSSEARLRIFHRCMELAQRVTAMEVSYTPGAHEPAKVCGAIADAFSRIRSAG